MGAGEAPAAKTGVAGHHLRSHRLDLRRPLAIPELAHVEVALLAVKPIHRQPTEEDVAGGLHQPLAGDYPVAVLAEPAGAGEGLQHRGAGFLHLQEERIALVTAEQQPDPGAGADAADPDDLVGGVDVVVALGENLSLIVEGSRCTRSTGL